MPAGRPKGSANKNKQALLLMLQDKFPDYHPIMEMAAIANDETQKIELRANMHKEIAHYVVPKRKAVEITGDLDEPLVVSMMIFSEDAAKGK